MEKIRDKINLSFENLFSTDKHPFFKDLLRVLKLSKQHTYTMKKYTKHTIEYKLNNTIQGSTIEPVYNILDKKKLYELMQEMNTIMNKNNILKLVGLMSQYTLQSTVANENKLYRTIKKEDTFNIMIIGSGPIGLFLACYLILYYNRSEMNRTKRINVVLYDSRIDKPGFRKPYTRQRPFATSSQYLNLIIPKLYCWNDQKNTDNAIFINIFMLEYVLYTTAIIDYDIQIIYQDYNWEDYKKIIDKGNFKVVFDCTGGRLENDAIKHINSRWISSIKQFNKTINKKLVVDETRNIVELEPYKQTSNPFLKNHYYGSISTHLNDIFVNKYDIDIVNNDDLLYLNKLKKKRYTYDEFMDILKGIKDNTSRNFLYSMMITNKSMHDKSIMVDVFSVYIRHAIKVSDIVKINNKEVLYIGAGDTIFHSHFITGSGLNRTIDFTVKCANIIEDLIDN